MYIEEPVTLTTEDGVEIEAMHHYDDALPLKTAITVMHPTTDVRGHFMMKWLVERGIGGFGFTSRYSSRESELIFENLLLDTAAGIEYLKSRGYQNVIGIGNSGGAEIVAGYQSQAVNPTIKSTPTGDPPDLTKAKLPPYDGLIFLNPHSGRALATTRGMDPSVGGEDGNDPFQYDPSLDLYNPENGPPYSQEFRDRYGAALQRAASEVQNLESQSTLLNITISMNGSIIIGLGWVADTVEIPKDHWRTLPCDGRWVSQAPS